MPFPPFPCRKEQPPVMLTPTEHIPWSEVTEIRPVKIPGVKLAVCLVETPAGRCYTAGRKADLEHIRLTAPLPA